MSLGGSSACRASQPFETGKMVTWNAELPPGLRDMLVKLHLAMGKDMSLNNQSLRGATIPRTKVLNLLPGRQKNLRRLGFTWTDALCVLP